MKILVILISLLYANSAASDNISIQPPGTQISYNQDIQLFVQSTDNKPNIDPVTTEAVCSNNKTAKLETCECIAAGSCKFRLESSCRIVFCDGDVLEDGTNSTVDSDKTVILKQPCKDGA